MKAIIVSAFPGCGKTHCYKNKQHLLIGGILDSDSSDFSWVKDSNGVNTKERSPDFPQNYINHIKENQDKVGVIFVSSHKEVRDALKENGLDYALVYPNIYQKENYLNRFKKRGNDENFIDFISGNWESFIKDMDKESFPYKVRLGNNSYLDENVLVHIMADM